MKKKDLIVTSNPTNTTLPDDVKLVFGIELLSLNLDLGRQDLNENFKKVEDKINELIRKQ